MAPPPVGAFSRAAEATTTSASATPLVTALQQRGPPLQRVADRDERRRRRGGHGEEAEPERKPAEPRGPGRKRSRREHQGQEPRTHA